jgi:thymidylate kinase
MTDVRQELDQRLPAAVAVTGRLVPGSADVELVVDDAAAPAVEGALSSLGYSRRGEVWARFSSCDADVVTVRRLGTWPAGAPAGEPQRMLAQAMPIEGCAKLRWLAPADELLVLAQRFARRPEVPAAGVREALHRALVADPSAWVVAAERAQLWRAEAAVRVAREAYDGVRTPGSAELRDLAAEAGPVQVLRTGVVALSGLDGSGKSTQSHALAATLSKLGHDTSVEWTRLSFDASLDVVAAPVKALLALRHRGSATTVASEEPAPAAVTPRSLRDRSPVVNHAWTAVVATANGSTQRRTTNAQLRAGRVVVRDRYVLDSVVQLHSVYGARDDVSSQARIVERLSPAPLVAFYLDVPPAEAYRRKPEEYTEAELAAHAALYRREAARLGVQTVDAARDRAELAAELGATVWRVLT